MISEVGFDSSEFFTNSEQQELEFPFVRADTATTTDTEARGLWSSVVGLKFDISHMEFLAYCVIGAHALSVHHATTPLLQAARGYVRS